MTKHEFASLSAKAAPPVKATRGEGCDASAYRRPQLFIAGSTVDLVQGCYCAPSIDLSGYYTYGDEM